jgi:hypothetical protein
VTAGIDDAKAVAFGIGENHEVGAGLLPVPFDALFAESHQARYLGRLIGGVPRVQVRVHPRMVLDRRVAAGQGQSRARLASTGTSSAQSSVTSYLGT